MFWIFLFLVSVFLVIYFVEVRDDDCVAIPSFITAVISAVVLVIILLKGITVYPKLVGELHKVKIFRQRIVDIKLAAYPEQPGKLVGGSLTNLQQSSKVSDYIYQLAETEARYNALLSKARYYKKDYWWVLFGHGFFISDKVFQLPVLKK